MGPGSIGLCSFTWSHDFRTLAEFGYPRRIKAKHCSLSTNGQFQLSRSQEYHWQHKFIGRAQHHSKFNVPSCNLHLHMLWLNYKIRMAPIVDIEIELRLLLAQMVQRSKYVQHLEQSDRVRYQCWKRCRIGCVSTFLRNGTSFDLNNNVLIAEKLPMSWKGTHEFLSGSNIQEYLQPSNFGTFCSNSDS